MSSQIRFIFSYAIVFIFSAAIAHSNTLLRQVRAEPIQSQFEIAAQNFATTRVLTIGHLRDMHLALQVPGEVKMTIIRAILNPSIRQDISDVLFSRNGSFDNLDAQSQTAIAGRLALFYYGPKQIVNLTPETSALALHQAIWWKLTDSHHTQMSSVLLAMKGIVYGGLEGLDRNSVIGTDFVPEKPLKVLASAFPGSVMRLSHKSQAFDQFVLFPRAQK